MLPTAHHQANHAGDGPPDRRLPDDRSSPSSDCDAPGKNGRIVFAAQVGKHMQLFTIAPDGKGLKQVTRFRDGSDALSAD